MRCQVQQEPYSTQDQEPDAHEPDDVRSSRPSTISVMVSPSCLLPHTAMTSGMASQATLRCPATRTGARR
jgi:hypothetical protein